MVHLNLEVLLKKAGKSKYWLVKNLETNYTMVNNMMNNRTTSIRFETIDKLCKLLNCDFNELFTKD